MLNKFSLVLFLIVLFTSSAFSQKLILQYDSAVQVNEGSVVRIGATMIKGSDSIKTKGLLKGNFSWRKFKVEVRGGSFIRGKVIVSKNQKELKNFSVEVKVTLKKDASVSALLRIPFLYSEFKEIDYTPKFFLPDGSWNLFPKPTCHSPHAGKSGQDGYDAANRDVYLDIIHDTVAKRSLIQIRIVQFESSTIDTFITDHLCHVSIIADGNDARSGWNGSDAKDKAADEVQKDCPCEAGNGGDGGNGGNGAEIRVIYNIALSDQIACLKISNKGGKAGSGGSAGRMVNNYVSVDTFFCNTKVARNGKNGVNGKDGPPVSFIRK